MTSTTHLYSKVQSLQLIALIQLDPAQCSVFTSLQIKLLLLVDCLAALAPLYLSTQGDRVDTYLPGSDHPDQMKSVQNCDGRAVFC